MAEKKSKVKAHRGFIHVPKRGGPRRPVGDPRFQGDPRRYPKRPPLQEIGPPSVRRYNDELRVLRDFAKARGKTIPKFPTGTPSPAIRRDPQKMKAFRLRQLQNQINKIRSFLNFTPRKLQQKMPTQKQINDSRKALSQNPLSNKQLILEAMGVRRQTTAPTQAVRNPNRTRRPMTAEPLAQKARVRMPNRRRTMVSKGGTVRKKK